MQVPGFPLERFTVARVNTDLDGNEKSLDLHSENEGTYLLNWPRSRTYGPMKTECPDCMKLLESFIDIPTTLERTRAVWATQECRGKHTLYEWVADPT